jgi:8-oxo-dGTP diphosphatase
MKRNVKVVGAVIVDVADKILCAKRSATNTILPNKWEFPGGKVEENEDEREALKREIKEELDCEIEVLNYITRVTHEYPNLTVQLTTYFAKIITGMPVNKEHEQLVWLQKSELRALDFAEADLPTIRIIEGS